jgi:hypothetical protein
MNKQKQTYVSPETEVFVVQIEDCILTVPSPLTTNALNFTEYLTSSGIDDGYEEL